MDKRYQVFVSSTYRDLIEERKEATQAILKCNCFPAGMELFPASNKKQWNVIKQVIDDSDFYLLILAGRYGSLGIDDSGHKIGYTEMEFDYAVLKEKPIIVMLYRNPETLPVKFTEKIERNIKRLEKFREKAMSGRMVAFWDNKDQLNGEILSSLHTMMLSTPEAVGWIRADAIIESNKKSSNLASIIEKFKKINKSEDKIKYLEDIDSSVLVECFNNIEFVNEFSNLINIIQPINVIRKAINLIPRLEYKAKKHLGESIDIKPLFLAQCKNEIFQETDLSRFIFQLLLKLDMYSNEYSKPIFNCIKTNSFSSEHKKNCIFYIKKCPFYNIHNEIGEELLEYILNEVRNEYRVLSITDLSDILTTVCKGEDGYAQIYNIFVSCDKIVQKEIIYSMFRNCGSYDLYITPKIQRMFLNMCNTVFSWEDENDTANLLLYCLFIRTSDIFTIDEIYNKLNEFNDDVFYIFFWNLGYGEFGMGADEVYEIDSEEACRINEIIKKRKHPREKKLLERIMLLP